MGMKHQVYMATSDDGIVGIDHPWLNPQKAVVQAGRMLAALKGFVGSTRDPERAMTKERGLELLKAVYSVIPEEQYYHRVTEIEDTSDPTKFANEAGITIFDFRDPTKPTYCFMPFGGMAVKNSGKFVPLAGYDFAMGKEGGEQGWERFASLMELDAAFQIFPALENAAREMISEE